MQPASDLAAFPIRGDPRRERGRHTCLAIYRSVPVPEQSLFLTRNFVDKARVPASLTLFVALKFITNLNG